MPKGFEKQIRETTDARILTFIKGSPGVTFADIRAAMGDILHWRQADKSIQRLRKAGLIKYTKKAGWMPLPPVNTAE